MARTVTYSNDGDSAVTLDLDPRLTDADGIAGTCRLLAVSAPR